MKRTLGLTLAIIISVFALVGMGGNNQQPAPSAAATPGFALVNVTQVYQESAIGVQAVGMLEGFQNQAMAILEAIQSDTAMAQQAGDAAAEQQYTMEMQSILYNAQAMLEEEQTRLGAVVNDFIVAQMEQFRKDKGLGVIFTGEAVQAYDPSLDLTAEFMQFLNSQSIDLGAPLTLERALEPYQAEINAPAPGAEGAAPEGEAAPEAAAPEADAPAVQVPETGEPTAPAAQ